MDSTWVSIGAGFVVIITPIAATIAVYASHKATTKVDIDNLRERVHNMEDDVDCKLDKSACADISGRLQGEITDLKATVTTTRDAVIRIETKMDTYFGNGKHKNSL